MNLFSSINALLLLVGLLILVLNLVFSAFRVSRGHLRAGIFSVVMTLLACVLLAIGLVRMSFPARASSAGASPAASSSNGGGSSGNVPPRLQTAIASGRIPPEQQTAIAQSTIPAFGRGNGGAGGNGTQPGGTPEAGGATGNRASEVGTPEAASTSGSAATVPPRLQTAIASGRIPPEQQTAIAQGTIPAFGGGNGGGGAGNGAQAGSGPSTPQSGGTQRANSGGFGGGAAGGGNGGANGGTGSTTGAAQNPETAADTLAAKITVIGALVILVSGLFLYFNERRRTGFEASSSPGLLYLGAGFFALIAALLIPALPGEFAVARASGQVAIVNQGNPNRILPTRVMRQQGSPTGTNTPSATATELPTLTTIPNATPTPLFTQVAYSYSDVSTPSACTITAQTTLNLRGDPSTQNQAIGRVFAGSLLRVTSRTADKKWWRVINSDGANEVEGWVSADYVTLSPACDSAPVIGPTPVGTKVAPTPQPSATSASKSTNMPNNAQATSTPVAPSANSAQTGSTAATCVVMTTTSASLRPDPSAQNPPLAQVPQGTALTASGKSAIPGWWQVASTSGGKTLNGWIGGSAVLAAANCSAVPVVTP